ncbi:MAG TPA: hypothetical protein VK574_08430 [Terracidiphilus sp.]|jgi:hypothetical protein|nr:hypothetical protein [Terracidiphilus sp.]
MKLNFRIPAIVTLVAITVFSQTLLAQTGRPSTKVDVPFAFDYGNQHFAAGIYTVAMRDQNILTINGISRTAWAMIQAGYDPTAHNQGCVTFRKYGDRYFLTEFSPANASIHASVFESSSEQRVARDFRASHVVPSKVQIALLPNYGDKSMSR